VSDLEKRLRKEEAEAIRKCSEALDALYNREDAPQVVDGVILYLAHTKGFNISVRATRDYRWLDGNNYDQWFHGTLDPDEAARKKRSRPE
jgi:hypothetical protein